LLFTGTISFLRPTAPFVSGGDSVVVVPTGGTSACARKLAETNGDETADVLVGTDSEATNGEGTVSRTFGSGFSCGSGGSAFSSASGRPSIPASTRTFTIAAAEAWTRGPV